jgi:hypothetical protein
VPALAREDLAKVGQGEISLDVKTKAFIRDFLSYRFVRVAYGEAKRIEDDIKGGALSAGKPLLNGKRDGNSRRKAKVIRHKAHEQLEAANARSLSENWSIEESISVFGKLAPGS